MSKEINDYIKLIKEDEYLQAHEGAKMADAMCGILQAKEEVTTKRVAELLDSALYIVNQHHYLLGIMTK